MRSVHVCEEKEWSWVRHPAISGVIYYGFLLLPAPRFWAHWQFWGGLLSLCLLEYVNCVDADVAGSAELIFNSAAI